MMLLSRLQRVLKEHLAYQVCVAMHLFLVLVVHGQSLNRTWHSPTSNTCITFTESGRVLIDELEHLKYKRLSPTRIKIIQRTYTCTFCIPVSNTGRFDVVELSDSLLILLKRDSFLNEHLQDSTIILRPVTRVACKHDFERWP